MEARLLQGDAHTILGLVFTAYVRHVDIQSAESVFGRMCGFLNARVLNTSSLSSPREPPVKKAMVPSWSRTVVAPGREQPDLLRRTCPAQCRSDGITVTAKWESSQRCRIPLARATIF